MRGRGIKMTSETRAALPADPWIEISESNVVWNLEQLRNRVGDTPLMAVVKCNGYGHGTVEVARILWDHGVKRFAAVKAHEVIALREQGIGEMVLNVGLFTEEEARRIVELDISQSVFSDAVHVIAGEARKQGKTAKVHIKVDTGLSRLGVHHEEAVAFIEDVAKIEGIEIEGVFTTLTEESDFDLVQIARLNEVCDEAEQRGLSIGIRHATSSCGTVTLPAEAYLDMVRPGNALYGFEPLPNVDLKPTLSLKARVLTVKHLKPGDTVAYHRVGKVTKPMTAAVLSLGYSDGYSHLVTERGEAIIHGVRVPFVFAMSANHCFLDVTELEDVQPGDEVVLIGEQGGRRITAVEVAEWVSSSAYKITTALSPLLPRIVVE